MTEQAIPNDIRQLTLDQASITFWSNHLADAPGVLTLPTDKPRSRLQSPQRSTALLALEPSLVDALRKLSIRQRTTMSTTLFSAWALLLSRLSGQETVVIGVPADDDATCSADHEGRFADTVPVCILLAPTMTVADLIVKVRDTSAACFSNRHVSSVQIADAIARHGKTQPSSVFQATYGFHDGRRARPSANPRQRPGVSPSQLSAHIDIVLRLREEEHSISGEFEFAADLFDESTIERWSRHFKRLLHSMESDDQASIDGLTLLDEADHRQILIDFNRESLLPEPRPFAHQSFEEQARRTPDAVAVKTLTGTLTYCMLNEKADCLASVIRATGVEADDRIVICADRNIEQVVGIFAILKAGAAYVPVDPAYPPARIAHILHDASPRMALVDVAGRQAIAAHANHIKVMELSGLHSEHAAPSPTTHAHVECVADNLAYLIYTSGSTGQPKGVEVEHGNLAASTSARHLVYGSQGDTVFLMLSSFAFDSSVAGLFGTLCAGGTLCLLGKDESMDPRAILHAIERMRVTTLLCVPSLAKVILAEAKDNPPPAGFRTLIVAGETCPPALIDACREALPTTSLFNEYGPTEASVWATVERCAGDGRNTVSIGRPIPGARIYVLDSLRNPVPIGVAGEIYVGGAGVARGYRNLPANSDAVFLGDPYNGEPGARMYRTGDLGKWLPDGRIDLIGRNDRQVKVRGFRVELGDIENALRSFDGVMNAVVVVHDAGEYAGNNLVAYVEVAPGRVVPVDGFRDQLATRVPEYMIPSRFLTMTTFPLGPNGKIDITALPGFLEAPPADADAPRPGLESLVAQLWMGLLRRSTISRHDDFFEIGGHSLLAVQLIAQSRKALGFDVSLKDIFRNTTVEKFSSALQRRNLESDTKNLIPIKSSGSLPPIFFVHPGGGGVDYVRRLYRFLDGDTPVYALDVIGYNPGEVPLSSVEDMASAYIRSIRATAPGGPFRLMGWSSGGIIALEMAKQLRGANEPVSFVGLIDTYRHHGDEIRSIEASPAYDATQHLLDVLEKRVNPDMFGRIVALSAHLDFDSLVEAVISLNSNGVDATMLPKTDAQTIRRILATNHALDHAVASHVTPTPTEPTWLFEAAEGTRRASQSWSSQATGLHVVPVPGDHLSMLRNDEYLQILGGKINTALRYESHP